MKFKFFKSVAAFLSLGILMTGCSSDDFLADNEIPVEKDTDFYINVKIATPAEQGTRGNDNEYSSDGSYVDGTPDEQTIHEILFVFFNSNYQYVGNSTYIPKAADMKPGDNGSVETVMNITVPVTVAAGSTKPAYVMAYVNPTNKSKNDLLNDYFTALGAFRKLSDVIPTANHKGYSMNNSVHYEQQKDEELPTIAVPIGDGQLFTSQEEAIANATTAQVIIYVERIVAKVTLNTSTEDLPETDNTVVDENEKKYTLKFEVLGWGLSNLERNTFLVKNFREEVWGNPTDFDTPFYFSNFKWSDLNDRLATQGGLVSPSWNYPGSPDRLGDWGISGHRTFWALSPTYYSKDVTIPSYADEIYDVNKVVDENGSSLIYRSFNNIYNTNPDAPADPAIGTYGKALGETQYTLEHTMRAEMVTDYQKRAVTSAIVVGKYKIIAEDGTNKTYDDDFFIRKIVTEANTKYILYPSVEEMKKAYLASNITIFIKNGENYERVPFANAEGGTITTYFDDFVIEHPRKDNGITEDHIPSRYVTLQLKNGLSKYFYQDANGAYVQVTESNLKDVNKSLYENMTGMLGGIEEYHSGYAYFEIPIRHLWGRTNKSIGEQDFVAKLGQYGVVRNHSYNISVEGIQGIGIGISDPDAPIIPNVENDKYFVKTEIRVQRWRVVPTQNVILRP